MQKRYLVLEDGRIFGGFAFGAAAIGRAAGEVVFTTNMTGFTETVTDPAFAGQIVVQTFPLVGNCGVNEADLEGPAPVLAGYVVKEACAAPSHFGCEETLDAFLARRGVPGIWGVDTRALTKLIRSEGTLRGMLCDDANAAFISNESSRVDAMARVSAKEPALYPAEICKGKLLLWDFGVRRSTLRWLNEKGYDVTVVPYFWSAAQVLAEKPDCILLPNGPGNPSTYPAIVEEIKELLGASAAIFAFGLGHQLLALANGGKTAALPYGHRGGCPVKDAATGSTYITGQNHGYFVSECPANAQVRYINANDQTCEGLDYQNGSFSVQFKPESCGCARDAEALFSRIAALVSGSPQNPRILWGELKRGNA